MIPADAVTLRTVSGDGGAAVKKGLADGGEFGASSPASVLAGARVGTLGAKETATVGAPRGAGAAATGAVSGGLMLTAGGLFFRAGRGVAADLPGLPGEDALDAAETFVSAPRSGEDSPL
jgi:hypothetical protein